MLDQVTYEPPTFMTLQQINKLFLLHDPFVLMSAKIVILVKQFHEDLISVIPSQPFRKEIIIHFVAFFSAGDDVFLQ